MCSLVQLNEALCASSPDLASPCDYQSPIDSANSLTIPTVAARRLSLGVRLSLTFFVHHDYRMMLLYIIPHLILASFRTLFPNIGSGIHCPAYLSVFPALIHHLADALFQNT